MGSTNASALEIGSTFFISVTTFGLFGTRSFLERAFPSGFEVARVSISSLGTGCFTSSSILSRCLIS